MVLIRGAQERVACVCALLGVFACDHLLLGPVCLERHMKMLLAFNHVPGSNSILLFALCMFSFCKEKSPCADGHFEMYRSLINDTYKMDLILIYPPYMIALACIYIASVLKEKDTTSWFEELRVDMNVVRNSSMEGIVISLDYLPTGIAFMSEYSGYLGPEFVLWNPFFFGPDHWLTRSALDKPLPKEYPGYLDC